MSDRCTCGKNKEVAVTAAEAAKMTKESMATNDLRSLRKILRRVVKAASSGKDAVSVDFDLDQFTASELLERGFLTSYDDKKKETIISWGHQAVASGDAPVFTFGPSTITMEPSDS